MYSVLSKYIRKALCEYFHHAILVIGVFLSNIWYYSYNRPTLYSCQTIELQLKLESRYPTSGTVSKK